MFDYLIIFLVGLVTSFASNITGGGGALILLPVLIWLGLSPIDAIGTIILGAVGFVIGSVFSNHARSVVRRDHVIQMVFIVAIASIIGPLVSVHLPQTSVKAISGALIIFTAIASLLTWKVASHARRVSPESRYIGYGVYFITSTLVAGFTSGIGLLSNYILVGLVGMSAIETIATRRIAGLIGVPVQLSIYTYFGHVHLAIGLTLALSNFIGAYFGINYAIKKGNSFVKKAMAITAIMLVVLLFF